MKYLIYTLLLFGIFFQIGFLHYAANHKRQRSFDPIQPLQYSAGIALPAEPKRYGPENSLFPKVKFPKWE
jgi:hypothetical protein